MTMSATKAARKATPSSSRIETSPRIRAKNPLRICTSARRAGRRRYNDTVITDRTHRAGATLAALLGPLAAVGIAWTLEASRSDLAMANVALLLAIVCLAAGSISRVAGVITSVSAGLALDYFHTEPVHSFRIHERDELVTVALLVTLGWMVSAVTALRLRRYARDTTALSRSEAARRLDALLADGSSAVEAWHAAVDAAAGGLANVDTRLVDGASSSLPRVARGGDGVTFVLPETGATIHGVGTSNAELLLTPRRGLGAVEVDRIAAVQFADDVCVALDAV